MTVCASFDKAPQEAHIEDTAPSILSGGTSPSDKAPFIEAVDGVAPLATLRAQKNFIAGRTNVPGQSESRIAPLDDVAPTVLSGGTAPAHKAPFIEDTGISDYVQQRIASGEVDHILKKHPPRRLDDVSSTIESNILRGAYYGTVEMEGTPEGPVKLRRLSALECAAIQSFPADWPFQGPKTAVYRQAGNAAPSGMIEPVARQIAELLNDEI